MRAQSLQSWLTLCDPMDCSPQGSSAHGIFSRQEYWSGVPFPPPGDLPDTGIEPCLLFWQAGSLLLSHQGSPSATLGNLNSGRLVNQRVHVISEARVLPCRMGRCCPCKHQENHEHCSGGFQRSLRIPEYGCDGHNGFFTRNSPIN